MATKKATNNSSKSDVSKDEQIGFHKGSLMTLSKEREELVRILGIVEQLMQMHATALKELGVELEVPAQSSNDQQTDSAVPKKKPPIEDLL